MILTLKNIYFLILKRVFSLIFESEYLKYLKYLLSYFEQIWQRCCSWKFQSDLISCSSIPYVAEILCEIRREKTDERKLFSPAMGTCYSCTRKVGSFQTSGNQGVVTWGLKWDQDSLFRGEICKRQKISLHQPWQSSFYIKMKTAIGAEGPQTHEFTGELQELLGRFLQKLQKMDFFNSISLVLMMNWFYEQDWK